MSVACLVLAGVLATVALMLLVRSFRRDDPMHAMAGMSVMIAAGIPAAVYGTISS